MDGMAAMNMPLEKRWVENLEDEDLTFLKRFLLASGSLKELAESYGVSYPTVRLRLDRLIQKVRILDDARALDAFERQLRAEFADGKLDEVSFRRLQRVYQQQKKAGAA